MEKKTKFFTNHEIAETLRSIAAAYEVLGENRFRIIAYDRAAGAIEYASSEIKDLWDEGKLEEVPGIGPNIATHLDELFRTGTVKHFEEVKSKLPPAMFKLLAIPGIGPKNAYKLALELKLDPNKAIDELKKAAIQGKIRTIEGFGEQSEKTILDNLARSKKDFTRMLLPEAQSLAEQVIDYLKNNQINGEINSLGSLRRCASTVGDIDLAVASDKPQQILDTFVKFPQTKQILAKGENTARILLNNNKQVDLKIVAKESFGSLLQHYTGSKMHNIKLRELAIKKGLSLSEYGIKIEQNSKIKDQKQVQKSKIKEFETEKDFYHYLGMEWIPPELREGTGEIEVAINEFEHKHPGLPKLVEQKDLLGDLHMHSDFPIEGSHDAGIDSYQKILAVATKLNYQYVGFTEHNPSLSKHTDNQIIEILKKKREYVNRINSARTQNVFIHVFNGLEIDIKPNGELAILDKGLDTLDFAIASIHSSFQLAKKQMTDRVLKGLAYPKVKIFGHPTGRKLGFREGVELDWDKILAFCLKKNIWLEVNAWPDRLDLPDFLVREAIKGGIKIIINSDSHAADQLFMIKYGVSVARRGWAEKKDVVNTLSLEKFKESLIV